MAVDLKKMSDKELGKLSEDIGKELKAREKGKREDARKAAEAAAKKHGFSLTELIGATKAKRSAAPAKYANPENPKQTWSGRGRQPAWYKDALAKGADTKALEV